MKRILLNILLIIFLITETSFAASVNVAVIDTGIHIKEDFIDDTKIKKGKNYVFENEDTDDKVGHGTRIASLILGTKEESILSPCENTFIVPLVYYTKLASGSVENGGIDAICNAIYDAVDIYDAKIINISSGVTGESKELYDAVCYAEENGVLVVAACGNDADDIFYPAAYDTVISVGSHDENGEVSDFSSKVHGTDLLTEGEDLKVLSIRNAQDIELISGTSYSAALISAQCAAILEKYPDFTPHELRFLLFNSCRDIYENGYDEKSGYGIFDDELFLENAGLLYNGEMICYSDVDNNDPCYEYIKFVDENKIMNGTGEYLFSPEDKLTRAMFITILYRLEKEPDIFDKAVFEDVKDESWYSDAVSWGVNSGIIKGTGNNRFDPDDKITKEQAITILMRYAEYKKTDVKENKEVEIICNDRAKISDYAKSAISWAMDKKIIEADDEKNINPSKEIKRGEAAEIITKMINSITEN